MRRAAWFLVVTILGVGCVWVAPPAGARDAAPLVAPMGEADARTDAMQTDMSARARRRAPTRLRVYRGSNYLPPSARRECRAWYVEEHRPSGTVIVPRQQCWWVRG